ncbi:MAG TPA: MBL fold metallo-hydrolase [Pseudonocardiaceae bacterium]|nr:MBL fold metallo-hydrolase [Pseudonocardiaceae bacterium]
MSACCLADSSAAAVRIEELATGVFAYIQPGGSWWINNCGFLTAGERTVLIDTCATEQRTRRLLAEVGRVTATAVSTVVNTHHHGDHTNGNYLTGAATIIGHRITRELMIAAGIQRYEQAFEGITWGGLRLRPPDVTFEDALTLYAGQTRVELRWAGHAAHTTSDVLVWLPEQSILFAGDLVVNGTTPFALMGSLAGWRVALQRIREIKARTIIPGHGDVCGPGQIEVVDDYLAFVQRAAREGINAGLTPLRLARDLDLGEFAALSDSERIVANLHRAYAELEGHPRGVPLDLQLPLRDMIALNGGQRIRCFA